MPIDTTLIAKKLDFLNDHLNHIQEMKFDEQEFVANADIHDLMVFRLQQAVEKVIDIAVHIISQLDIPRKETAKDAFLVLGEQQIIDSKLAQRMGQAADFRNRAVHGYNDFDFRLLFRDYKNNLADLRSFGSQILVFLEEQRKLPKLSL